MKNQSFLELIETYEELVNVVYDIGNLSQKSSRQQRLYLIQRRTELLGDIEDQRHKLLINQF